VPSKVGFPFVVSRTAGQSSTAPRSKKESRVASQKEIFS
jgi:hypothetical protein